MLSKVHSAVFFACADDGIGKFDRSMLSQQDLMDLSSFGSRNQRRYVEDGMIQKMYVDGRG